MIRSREGINWNETDINGRTGVHSAAAHGHNDVVRCFAGTSDVNIRDVSFSITESSS